MLQAMAVTSLSDHSDITDHTSEPAGLGYSAGASVAGDGRDSAL